jgi:alpha-L-rhamnosidase
LYTVNLGATTIWERWNSLNPDGTVSSTGMNSFNHYAYGSIVEWMYRDMCGLNQSSGDDLVTGFRHARIAPKPDKALKWARARYRSAAGWYVSEWQIDDSGCLTFDFTIPFNATACVVLPDARVGEIAINGAMSKDGRQVEREVVLELGAGQYTISYQPTRAYYETFSIETPIIKLVRSKKAVQALAEMFPMITMLDESMLAVIGEASIRDMTKTPYLQLSEEQLVILDQYLKEIRS